MSVLIGTLSQRLQSNASAVATACGGGTTAAEIQALAAALNVAALRPFDFFTVMQLAGESAAQLKLTP
jgi:hypothetical protein